MRVANHDNECNLTKVTTQDTASAWKPLRQIHSKYRPWCNTLHHLGSAGCCRARTMVRRAR